MYSLFTCYIIINYCPIFYYFKDSLQRLSRDDTIRHARNLVAYLLDQQTSAREGPRGFEKR